ncbi:hypothetical protein [Amycolatopsis rubida]|uniref:DUF3558 domain-containing protein n=1 Tax=Amycolatopsis rubida TaxID=112413 RepID=A0A1I5EEU5_9PSEU|nr:hypothetical protein [Amycolatopsis rubida]SFO09786.1 hypothetical protein SAMN05421854_101609 [Amycolatopsis rubida]
MTDSPGDGRHSYPVAGQPYPPPGQGFGYPPPAKPPGPRTGLIVAGAIGLVVILGVGIAIGLSLSGGSSAPEAKPAPAAPSPAPSTTASPAAPPGKYSMSGISDACALLDPKPLAKWSATPIPPVHREGRPSEGYGGDLSCSLRYTSTSATDGVATNEAGIAVRAEFASADRPPAYEQWNTKPSPGWTSGTTPGLGTRNYWRAGSTTEPGPGASYIVGVEDSNVTVEIQVAVHRAPGETPLKMDELSSIARSQARAVLDRLRKP